MLASGLFSPRDSEILSPFSRLEEKLNSLRQEYCRSQNEVENVIKEPVQYFNCIPIMSYEMLPFG